MLARRLCVLGVLFAATVCLADGESESGPVAVVVSAAWETPDEIPLTTLRRLYMGRLTRWAGRRIERYELAPGSPARASFASAVMGLSERELEDYWLEQALTGGAIPPREVEGVAEMELVIADRVGSIGYVPLAALASDGAHRLRVLAVRHEGRTHRPGDPDYPIRPSSPDERKRSSIQR
jgi:hypothetical protein